jgi:hypothetical protein
MCSDSSRRTRGSFPRFDDVLADEVDLLPLMVSAGARGFGGQVMLESFMRAGRATLRRLISATAQEPLRETFLQARAPPRLDLR